MKEMTELSSIEETESFVASHALSFLYVSRPDCSVCHALLPKLRSLLDQYPDIRMGHIDAGEVEEVAGKYLIFTVPTMLLLAGDREYLRADRFVRFERLQEQLEQITAF